MTLTVAAEAEPELDEGDLIVLGGDSPLDRRGASPTCRATLADRLRIRGAESGAVIVDVEPRSPAARVGFRPGDVVVGRRARTSRAPSSSQALVEAGSRLWRISFSRGGRVSNIVIGG